MRGNDPREVHPFTNNGFGLQRLKVVSVTGRETNKLSNFHYKTSRTGVSPVRP